MLYSVIDISSSSLSMIIADHSSEKTEIIFKDRTSLSLIHYLEGKKLSERGQDKLTDFLKAMLDKCRRFKVKYCYLISTAALRYIQNYAEVNQRVFEKTGLTVNFIDGKTEAFCDYIANQYYSSYEKPVLIDLGGKSLEICDLSKTDKEDMVCFDFGLLDLHRKFIRQIQPTEKEVKDIKKFVVEKFNDAELPKQDVFKTAVMVGATSRAIYDIYLDFTEEKDNADVKTIKYKKFKKLVYCLLYGSERSNLILNNAPEKLYLIASAAITLKVLFKRFDVDSIVVSDRGVKEGYLQLVLEGKEVGIACDLESELPHSDEHISEQSIQKNKGKKKNKSENTKVSDK